MISLSLETDYTVQLEKGKYFKGRVALEKFLASKGLTEVDLVKPKWGTNKYKLYLAHNNHLYCILLPSTYYNMSIEGLENLLEKNDIIKHKEDVVVKQPQITEPIHFGGKHG